MSKSPQHSYEFGSFVLDARTGRLLRGDQHVPLTKKEFELLVVLVESGGGLLSKDELMEALWPDTNVGEATLTQNISTLRKALGSGYIETEPKRGYRFVAEVRLERRTRTHIVTEEVFGDDERARGAALAVRHSPAAAAEPRRARRRPPLALALIVAALCVATAAAGSGVYRLIRQRRPAGAAAAAAVPFGEMSISRLTTSGRVTHAAISPGGEYFAHVTSDAEGDSLWVRHVAAPAGVRIAGPAATEYVSVTFAPDGGSVYYLTLDRDKGHTALYRVPVLGGPSSLAVSNPGPVGFSPDGSRIAFIRMSGGVGSLLVANADGTDERVLATRRQPEYFRVFWNAPAWSPDAKTIACQARLSDERGQYETIVGVSVEDGSQRPLTSVRWGHTGQPVWLADGSGLLLTASESAPAPVQVWHVSREGGEARRVTRDLSDYRDLSLTRDMRRLLAVEDHTVSNVWIAPEGDAGRARQIASEAGSLAEVAWTPDGRIVYRSNAGGSPEIWVMSADGSNPKQITTGARVSRGLSVSPDGRYIFFASARAGRSNIWRVDADGRNLTQLTKGEDEFDPHPTPDGRWVVFQRGEFEPRLWKVWAEGGEPVQLTETRARRPAVSPDGELIAYHYLEPDVVKSRWRIGIVSSGGGRPLKRFDFPPTVSERFVRWTPGGRSIAYANTSGGLHDIWAQPLDGSPTRQLTGFKAERIIAFDWSPDGRTLLFVRGVETSDVVLIGNAALNDARGAASDD